MCILESDGKPGNKRKAGQTPTSKTKKTEMSPTPQEKPIEDIAEPKKPKLVTPIEDITESKKPKLTTGKFLTNQHESNIFSLLERKNGDTKHCGWSHCATPLALQELPLVSLYVCPRCKQQSSQRAALRFDSGMQYVTVVQCQRCIWINKKLTSVLSGYIG